MYQLPLSFNLVMNDPLVGSKAENIFFPNLSISNICNVFVIITYFPVLIKKMYKS